MSTFLVTGGAGFIGSAIAQSLISQGHIVVTIDNLTTGSFDNIPEGVFFIEGNCQDDESINKLKEFKFDAILHLAGQSSGEISFDDPEYDLRTNTEATLKLLQYAKDSGCNRFLFASTMSVYGKQTDAAVCESAHTHPESFYGVGKLASEHYLRLYQSFGIETTSLRLFNVYGPGQSLTNMRQGMVSIFLSQMLNDSAIHVKGSKDRYRDFVFIDDVVNSFVSSINNQKTFNQIINVATGIRTTVDTLISKLTFIHGQDCVVKFEGNTEGDVHGIYANNQKYFELITSKPLVTLDFGLKKMVDWAVLK
jgi:UDP-glucose 4-epimerase